MADRFLAYEIFLLFCLLLHVTLGVLDANWTLGKKMKIICVHTLPYLLCIADASSFFDLLESLLECDNLSSVLFAAGVTLILCRLGVIL